VSTSSADTELLRAFVDDTAVAVTGAEVELGGVASLQASVADASPDYRVDAPVVDALTSTLSAMRVNERFVSTIRAELLAADAGGAESATVADVRLQLVLDGAGLGVPPPVLHFDPARLHGLPPTSGFVDDPICAANGNMVHQDIDLVFPGIASSLDLVRTYNSLRTSVPGAFGPGWSSVLDVRLVVGDGRVEIVLPDGGTALFTSAGDGWQAHGRRVRRLVPDAGGWLLAVDDVRSFLFDRSGCLTGWAVGASVVDVRRKAGRIASAHERHSGRSWSVEWHDGSDEVAIVTRVLSSDGRAVSYRRDDAHRLARASSASGHLDYEWREGFLTAVVDADGVRVFQNQYDGSGRVLCQTSPFGRTTSYRYERDGLTVVSDGTDASQAMVHDRRGNLTAVIDSDGSAMRLRYDAADRVVEVVDRGGVTWRQRFDGDGRLTARIDPDGLSESWEWDTAGRLASRIGRGGAVTTFEYAGELRTPQRVVHPDGTATSVSVEPSIDRPRTVTREDGMSTRLEYDTDGQPVAAVGPSGEAIELRYDAAGRISGFRDGRGTSTALVYDDRGRLVRWERGGAVAMYQRTPAGRVRGGTEPGGGCWSAVLGRHGMPVEILDGCAPVLRFEYDAIGNVVAVTGPDGAVHRHEYDDCGRLLAYVDPAGARTRARRDSRGNIVAFTDDMGRELRRDVDVFGRTVRTVTSEGNTAALTYHACGGPPAVDQPESPTRPLEAPVESPIACLVDRDSAGRVVSVTDATGVGARYEWDSRGLLVAAIDPAGLRTEYSYDGGGRLVTETAPAGRVSTWEYDAAGRVAAHRDPAGVETRFVRDAAGVVTEVLRGDARGAATRLSRRDWAAIRLVSAAEHDPAGRIVRDVEGATYDYDRAGRLIRVAPPDAAPTLFEYGSDGLIATERRADHDRRYRYDVAGRVASVAVDDGPTTRFVYDSAGRRTREIRTDGHQVQYVWEALDRLVEVVRVTPDGRRSSSPVASGRAGLGSLVPLASRVLDADTHQFLSPDPLPAVPGSNGSASAYTYAWHDPVNFVDPSGMRPISQAEWDAIRQREERGRLGTAWDAVADDPWGSLALGVVIVGGAVLCVTPLQPVGVGILIGAGASTGAGLASGTLDPRQAALAGVAGGVGAGLGAAVASVGWSVASGGAVGGGGDLAAQLLAGGPVDWHSVAVTAGVSSLTGGITNRLGGNPAVGNLHTAAVGGVTEAGGSVVAQALTGDRSLDLTELAFAAATGGASGVAGDSLRLAPSGARATGAAPGDPWRPMPDLRSIVLDVDRVVVRQVADEPPHPGTP
jgi:RHS repeat-associated protein